MAEKTWIQVVNEILSWNCGKTLRELGYDVWGYPKNMMYLHYRNDRLVEVYMDTGERDVLKYSVTEPVSVGILREIIRKVNTKQGYPKHRCAYLGYRDEYDGMPHI